ncbi:hypothetical protein FB45DRAFT_1033278 [Roridomyces roridus]|uniref:Uncharacterized protein n=1 Tax=Roridomyces roridus TaxID=1738132 RepID=A0AAD7BFF1_9AGAR|nr:hypothetical protein FB45DRAFT_1033278 [Roridomyces roridus]
MRVFLWILKEAGCKNVPSFDYFKRLQTQIRAESGIPSIPCKSTLGNVFFINDPRAIIAQDWSNPDVRKHIHVYPEIPEDGIIREIWHAEKWRKGMDLDCLSPMYAAGLTHYYVNEIAQLKDGTFVVPIRWVMFRSQVFADVYTVSFNEQNKATIEDSCTIYIRAGDLEKNLLDLQDENKVPQWSAQTASTAHPNQMPNPKRTLAKGRRLYHSFVDYFGDDVSGNRTKSWNKHWNAYMAHRNLPRRLLLQEFHVHFVSTSPNATITEQFQEFKNAVEATHEDPVEVDDDTCFCLYANAGPSDNPMQSEICGHIGGKGNRFCRKCNAGGTQAEKKTDEGYHALFEAGSPRSKHEILTELEKQVRLACAGAPNPVQLLQRSTGVKDAYTQRWIEQLILQFQELKSAEPDRSDAEIEAELIQWTLDNRDKIYSPFLTMKGFDPTKDTPVEILHTILLGVIKYVWHVSHSSWSPESKKLYSVRLQSTETSGLSIHAIRAKYIMQYAGSLIGRQFKTIVQTNTFHVRGIVTDHQFMAWKAAGELSALLWCPKFRNLEEYRKDLRVAVANMLDVVAMIDPSKIITKIKYHLLAHVEEDAVQFGPLVGVATEIFESFNAIFRYCSILSNHLAPSRDIVHQLGDQETLKHRLTGGRWFSKTENEWRAAGSGVREFLVAHPILQRLLGWAEPKNLKSGHVKLTPLKRRHGEVIRMTLALKDTVASKAINYGSYLAESSWQHCCMVVSEALDECGLESWVFSKSAVDETAVVAGKIATILKDVSGQALVVLEFFQVSAKRDDVYGMPVLTKRDSEMTYMIVPSSSIKFNFNAQHDCSAANCEATGERERMQERVASDDIETFIVHNPLDRYLINTHVFHNAHLLRATLPRDLVAPIPVFQDRRTKHDECAATFRVNKSARKKAKESESGGNKKTAGRKRKAPVPQADLEGEGDAAMEGVADASQPRRKRARTEHAPVAPSSTQATPPVPATSGGDGLTAGRSKRTITKSARLIEAEKMAQMSSESSSDDEPDDDDSDY